MLEDFYSDFFPVSLAGPGAQGLRESCSPSSNTAPVSRQAAWGVQRHPEPQQSQSSAAEEEEEALLCRERLLRVAGCPWVGEGEVGRPAARGRSRRPQAQPALPGGDPSAGFKRQRPAGQERRGPAKVPRPAAPTASRGASPDSGRPRSPELLVPDSDYMDEAESESKWRHCRRTPQAGGPSPPHQQPAGGGEPGGRAPPTPRGDPRAGLGPAAGGEAAALRLQAELWGAADPARPGLWPEGEEAIGGCGRSASPRSLADLEDQVLTDCWLPEE